MYPALLPFLFLEPKVSEVLFDFSEVQTPQRDDATIGPAAPDLRVLFGELNETHFDNFLPDDFDVYWCNLLRTTAGKFQGRRLSMTERKINWIRMSHRLFAENGWNPKEIRLTMIHEMAHCYLYLKYGNYSHDRQFQRLMDRLVGYRKSHTYHTYDTRNLRNVRRNIVEIYCTGCECVVGTQKKMPAKKHRNNMVHRTCRSKLIYRSVPINSSEETLFDFSL